MRISKRQLKRIIAEEYEAIADNLPPAPPAPAEDSGPVSESVGSEEELVTEINGALESLQSVVESLESAASICTDCVQEVAAQGPVLQAAASQAAALQEMLEAQVQVVSESSAPGDDAPSADPVDDVVAKVQAEVRRRRLSRRRRR